MANTEWCPHVAFYPIEHGGSLDAILTNRGSSLNMAGKSIKDMEVVLVGMSSCTTECGRYALCHLPEHD